MIQSSGMNPHSGDRYNKKVVSSELWNATSGMNPHSGERYNDFDVMTVCSVESGMNPHSEDRYNVCVRRASPTGIEWNESAQWGLSRAVCSCLRS